jgi:hypothetical protein
MEMEQEVECRETLPVQGMAARRTEPDGLMRGPDFHERAEAADLHGKETD